MDVVVVVEVAVPVRVGLAVGVGGADADDVGVGAESEAAAGVESCAGFSGGFGEVALDLLRGDDGEDLGATLIVAGEVPSEPGENLRCEGSE